MVDYIKLWEFYIKNHNCNKVPNSLNTIISTAVLIH